MFRKTHTGSERLSVWRKFRQDFPKNGTIENVIDAFSEVKVERRNIDYYTPESWPTPFEIVNEGMFCQSGLSLVIASTLIQLKLIKSENYRFDVVSNHITGTDGLVFVHEGFVYNFLPNQAVPLEFCEDNSTKFSSHIIAADKLGC